MNSPASLTSKHPCFSKAASAACGRAHLPVAPKCNIQCNYCNRKYDCVNESRPGVTSAVLKPYQALEYTRRVLDAEPRITVIGIAGPGDPMANPDETLETLRLIRQDYPDITFCLSSNGLALAPHVEDLASLGVSHATVTMNTIDPAIGAHIYAWVRQGKVVYRGRAAAEILLENQLASIAALKTHGLAVKVNTIVIPGVNDEHIAAVAAKCQSLGVDLHNLMPMHPNAGTPFGCLLEPSKERMHTLRAQAGEHLPQMTHCRRCRADAVGLLCSDRSTELGPVLSSCGQLPPPPKPIRPHIAVATRGGLLIDQRLGEARRFQIWTRTDSGAFRMIEERPAPLTSSGPSRWKNLATLLGDCQAVLANIVGESPRQVLSDLGLEPVACSGYIEDALRLIYNRTDGTQALRDRSQGQMWP